MATKPVLGIDLGTSNSAAAWVDDKGRVRVAAVRQDAYLLPSVVWYAQKGQHVLVGQPARQQLIDDPQSTIFGFKRFLGLRYNSPFVHRHKDRFAFELVEGPDGLCAVKIGDQTKPLEDVAVDVLKRLAELAAVSHGAPFEECMVAVPAHFGFGQRAVIRRAARRAGLKVRGMVNEPTAAAMYYARQKGRDGTVLIFDLGGGTFDATLMAIVSGVVKVLATGGDAFLGGADFDGKLLDHLSKQLEDQRGIDIRGNTVATQRVLVAAEAAKIDLSTQEEVRLRVPCVAVKGERFIDLDTRLTRKELEELTAPLIEKALGVCEDILKRAEVQPLEVDEVVFVGGMTRMPLIRKRLNDIFVANRAQAVHPDLGVVVGTALLTQGDRTLIDVSSMSVGVTLPGGVSKELVPANTPVPSVQRIALERPPEGQPLVIGVYEAVDAVSLERGVLGTVRVPAEWLKAHPGSINLEAFLGADLEVSLFLVDANGTKLSLELFQPAAPAKTDPKLNHPGFRSIGIEKPASTDVNATDSSVTAEAPVSPPESDVDDVAPPVAPKKPPKKELKKKVEDAVAVKKFKVHDDRHDDQSTGGEESHAPEMQGAPTAGDVVGGYLLLDVIGRGGMGRVYLAEHKKLGRRVAMKMLRRRMVKNRTAVERFLSEARAVNQIRHENIIEVTDLFETDDGQLCTIMELLEGRSLAGLLRSVKTVRPERAVRIGYQVASAMVAVHDAHIIHRDIKPENVFLTSRGGRDDFVKLLDFGVAKLVDDDGKSLHDTGIGATVGTRNYMSSEQLVGTGVDHRADIFSLGVVLYEMLAGGLPFKSDTDRGMLFAQLEKPAAPGRVDGLVHAVPEALSELVMQCLENDAAKRPQTMREVKGRLEALAESFTAAHTSGAVDDDLGDAEASFFGGLDVSAVMPGRDTAPEHAAVSDDGGSLPEANADDVVEAPRETSDATVASPASPGQAPPPRVVRTGVSPGVVVALMASTAAVSVLASWLLFR